MKLEKIKKREKIVMYILEYLKNQGSGIESENLIEVEYRLICSGELYNSKVATSDWRKSDATRLLLTSPFELAVISRPFNDYPQELSLRFKTHVVTKAKKNVSYCFLPDYEIAQDIAALLSLLCRRYISVAAKVREVDTKNQNDIPRIFRDSPVPFTTSVRLNKWRLHTSTLVFGPKGIEEVVDYNPAPKPIDPSYLQKMFMGLPYIEYAERIISSTRLYASALELIQEKQETSYQLLISCIEAMADDVFNKFELDKSEMVEEKKSVKELAIKFGLKEEEGTELAVEACKGMNWCSKKFKKFIVDNINEELWEDDDLFKLQEFSRPKKENFESAISKIYNMRGKYSHTGLSYPLSAKIGLGPMIPVEFMLEINDLDNIFPSVYWFERAVNISVRRFIEHSIDQKK